MAAVLNRVVSPSVESDVILSVGEGGGVHKVYYGHKRIEGCENVPNYGTTLA
jgi:hypothetical protein